MDRYTCEEVFRRLNDYVDRELSEEDTARVREHLEICRLCAEEFAFEAQVLDAVREKVQQIAAPQSLLSRIAQSLERAQAKPGSSQ